MGRVSLTFASCVAAALLLGAEAPLAAAQQDKPAAAKAGASAPLNLNTATQAQLEELPGIGAATAKRIVEYRQKNGAFKKVEELMNVKGIGEKSFLKLKPYISVAADKAAPGEKQ